MLEIKLLWAELGTFLYCAPVSAGVINKGPNSEVVAFPTVKDEADTLFQPKWGSDPGGGPVLQPNHPSLLTQRACPDIPPDTRRRKSAKFLNFPGSSALNPLSPETFKSTFKTLPAVGHLTRTRRKLQRNPFSRCSSSLSPGQLRPRSDRMRRLRAAGLRAAGPRLLRPA